LSLKEKSARCALLLRYARRRVKENTMPGIDRTARIAELRRLVQSGKYQVDAQAVAAKIIRESETRKASADRVLNHKAVGTDG
jgi:hypothetical protein